VTVGGMLSRCVCVCVCVCVSAEPRLHAALVSAAKVMRCIQCCLVIIIIIIIIIISVIISVIVKSRRIVRSRAYIS